MFGKKKDAETQQNGKPKKKHIGLKIFLVILVLFIIFRVVSGILYKGSTSATQVDTMAVTTGDIEEIVSISGNVVTNETKTYYAGVSGKIAELSVKAGDRVAAGDVMVAYDADNLDLQLQQAELTAKGANGSYSDSIERNMYAATKKGNMSTSQVNARIIEIQNATEDLNNRITEKTERMQQTLYELQRTTLDLDQNGEMDNGAVDKRADDGGDLALEHQEAIADVSYAISHDPELVSWKQQITDMQNELSDLQTAQNAMTGGAAQNLSASKETTELTTGNTIEKIQEAQQGVTADFNGVVTALGTGADTGASVAEGSPLVTVDSIDNIKATVQISKSDLAKVKVGQKVDIKINGNDYEGEVSKVAGTAVKNASGVPVVAVDITISNPDDSIILGVEASCKIHAEKAENTIVVPYQYINTDTTGDFAYVLENGIITRRDVKVGLTTSSDAQIIEGLNEGDQLITSDASALVEGDAAQATEATVGTSEE